MKWVLVLNIKKLKWLSIASCIGMFMVLLAGTLVTKTGSGRGCGDDFPLCNGKFIPAYTVESIIEYSHRAVSGFVGLVIVMTAIAMFMYAKKHKDAQFFAYGALFFTLLQAVLGAFAVKWEQSSIVMALHFGFSLLAFSCTLMLVLLLRRAERGYTSMMIASSGEGKHMSRPLRNGIWFVTAYTYVVVYVGAFVRHTDSAGGCTGWPLCNGQVIPEMYGGTGIAFAHRLAALLLLFVMLALYIRLYRYYRTNREFVVCGHWAMLLLLAQIFSGGWVASTFGSENIYLFTSMLHTIIVSGLFGLLCYISFRAWQIDR